MLEGISTDEISMGVSWNRNLMAKMTENKRETLGKLVYDTYSWISLYNLLRSCSLFISPASVFLALHIQSRLSEAIFSTS